MSSPNWFREDEIPYAIELSPQALQRLSDQWNMQMRRPPSSEELNGLVEQHIKEEIYYREAQRLDLETNDTIVRRRMVQKLTFLTEDIATATAPTETELLQYYETHRETYMRPKRVSFKTSILLQRPAPRRASRRRSRCQKGRLSR